VSEPFLGEIRTFAFNYAPKNWALCQGQLLSISQYTALFSLLGTVYGGDGRSTFALPDLRDRAPLHFGTGVSGTTFALGQAGGESTHSLTTAEIPAHTHTVSARAAAAVSSPAGALWAQSAKPVFATTPTTTMNAAALATTGSSQPHDNMPPYLVLNFAIALAGIFPSRN
jgi:microcystin-dependent protein